MKLKIIIIVLLFIGGITFLNSCYNKNGKVKNSLPQTISYNFHIRPILSDKCFKCHGPYANKREAHLRLDIADSAYAPLTETKGAFAIIPGKPEESELYKRIISDDSSYMMPSPEGHLGGLTQYEIALFKKWILQGAKYETHWAFIAPQKKPLPIIDNKSWVKNEIDYFIENKLEEKGLTPNEEADKERLLKRASLDITGLPPSIAMMDKLLNDKSVNGYEKIIDELLTTSQYGEKMAVTRLYLMKLF